MDYGFGAARQLYADKLHPRIYLGPDDLPVLRRQIKTGAGKKIMTGLRLRVAPPVADILGATDLVDMIANWNTNWHMPGTRVVMGLFDIAMVGVLDQDADALEAVRRVLRVCPTADKAGRQGVRRLGYSALGQMVKAYDLIFAHLDEDERATFRRWACNQGIKPNLKMLRPNYFKTAGGNMCIGGMCSSILTFLAMDGDPGVPDLTASRELVLKMFEASLYAAIGPDGYPEEDGGYGNGIGAALSLMAEPLRRAGVWDVYQHCPRYAKFGQALLHFVQPWGAFLSNTGDHGDDFGQREFVLARLAEETDDPALLWLLGTLSYDHGSLLPENSQPEFYREVKLARGFQVPTTSLSLLTMASFAKAAPPASSAPPTAFRDRARGIVSFRSGWRANDTMVVFDGSQRSPAAQGHAHASCGHFSISALGEYFAIDTGRYNNEQNCHSVVLIDGKSGRSTNGEWHAMQHAGRLIHYHPGEFVDVAAVDSSHQHNCIWARRHLGLIKGRGAPAYVWTVDDLNTNNDWAEYVWQLQTSPENTIRLHRQHAVVTGWRHGNAMSVHWVLPPPSEYPKAHSMLELSQDEATPSSYKYIPKPHARAKDYVRPSAMVHGPAFVRPRLLARYGGYNGRCMALMLPRRKGDKPPTVRRLPAVSASLAVRITFADVEDTLIFAHEHHLLEAGDIKARGSWCVVRRARSSGRVTQYAVGEGTRLEIDGKQLAL